MNSLYCLSTITRDRGTVLRDVCKCDFFSLYLEECYEWIKISRNALCTTLSLPVLPFFYRELPYPTCILAYNSDKGVWFQLVKIACVI